MSALPPPLRTGWTTGACATAAAAAAAEVLFGGASPTRVTIDLPRGGQAEFDILAPASGPGWTEAAVIKDAGDDPDVTHGATIRTRLDLMEDGHGIRFAAGSGVGTVTKPGLPIPPGEPAINPVPRAMISAAIEDAARRAGRNADLRVTVSVPDGEALALKTWNGRLGIVGGISILGTTGIVRPFSCAAWIASIHRGIDVARANGLDHVAACTGATSEATVAGLHALPEIAFLDMGDFAGGTLKYLRRNPVPKLTLAGGPGKLTKLAQGALDLHSARSQVDFAALGRMAAAAGANGPAVAAANTALEAVTIAGAPLAKAIATGAERTVREVLGTAPVAVEMILVDRTGNVLARRDFA